ncbi:MAG: hypothetical protein KJ955_05285 [Nanoarchaeota archaeon]|nr:hypothetical protein [Nanoarchaeota archaeon]
MAADIVLFDGTKFNLGFDLIMNASAKNELKIIECSEEDIRTAVEAKKADIILVSEKTMQDSMHYRKTALDNVICTLANKKNIAFAFSFSAILNAKNRAVVMGKVMQNIRICRKYKARMLFASFAKSKYEMRGKSELQAFARVLGMTAAEAGMNTIEDLISLKKKGSGVRVIE